MASFSKQPNGTYRIEFFLNGKRKSIRPRLTNERQVEKLTKRIESLITAKATNEPVDVETAKWVSGISDVIHKKLVKVGLVKERIRFTVGEIINKMLESKASLKPNTQRNLRQATTKFITHFGLETQIEEITPEDVKKWIDLLRQSMANAYLNRTIKYAKQIFNFAIELNAIQTTPMAKIKAGTMANPNRLTYVSKETIEKVISVCPSAEFRLVIAFARYAGLRCPSELVTLRWEDINWNTNRFIVRASKTAHLENGGIRELPIFADLRPHLTAYLREHPTKTGLIFPRTYSHETNLREKFERYILKAGIPLWPRLFQNLRSSVETELSKTHSIQTACAWLGNSPNTAMKHYLQVLDEDFNRAATGEGGVKSGVKVEGKAVESVHASVRQDNMIGLKNPAEMVEIAPKSECLEKSACENYARQESNL